MPSLTYKVTFDPNGGSGGPGTVTYSSAAGASNVIPSTRPKRSGCTLLGWNTKRDGTGTNYAIGAQAPTSATTLYAAWAGLQVTSISAYRSNASGTRERSGAYGHVVVKTKAISTVAGTVSVSASYREAGSSSASQSITLSPSSYAKTASADASATHTATFGGALSTSTAYSVQVTGYLQGTYAGSSYVVPISGVAVATVPKAWALFSALAGGAGLAIGTVASLASVLETAFRVQQSATALGYWLRDGTGYDYPGIRDSGTNLWLGNTASNGRPHFGATYISAGLNPTGATYSGGELEKAAGNTDAYLSVVEDWTQTDGVRAYHNYKLYHAGNALNAIVTHDQSNSVSVPSASWTSLGSVDLAAGVWVVSYNSYFASNATGRRGMLIHTVADATNAANLRSGGVEVMAVNGGVTMLNACRILNITSSATYHLNVMQSSGAALNVTGYICAVRLK